MDMLRSSSGEALLRICLVVAACGAVACAAEPGGDGATAERAATSGASAGAISAEAREAIAAADWAYAEAWLTNEPETVMRTLGEHPVIVPSGQSAILGADSIRAFWWPEDGPPTEVTGYAVRQEEIGGSGDLGFVRGGYSLSFTYDGTDFETEGTYLSLLRRGDRGWRITHRVWNDHGLD